MSELNNNNIQICKNKKHSWYKTLFLYNLIILILLNSYTHSLAAQNISKSENKKNGKITISLPIKKQKDPITKNSQSSIPPKSTSKAPKASLDGILDDIDKRYYERKPIVVIDAGHGGKDPGAIGYSGIKEKNITLAYATALAKNLKTTGEFEVYLTRDSDIFIPLRGRNRIGRKFSADFFIAIHADSAENSSAKGLSIYTLSNKASDKEAEMLAKKENRADLVAGINLQKVDEEIVSEVLIDLSLNDAMNYSLEFAKTLQNKLKGKIEMRTQAIHSVGFVVLKNPNMVSILLELGYLSNKNDESKLANDDYKEKLIYGISSAIKQYFSQNVDFRIKER